MTSGGMDDEDAGITMPGNGHTERPDDIRRNGHRRGSKKEQAECKRNKVNEKRRREGEKEKRANGG